MKYHKTESIPRGTFDYVIRIQVAPEVRDLSDAKAREIFELELKGAIHDARKGARKDFEIWLAR